MKISNTAETVQFWGKRLFLLIAGSVGFVFFLHLALLLVFALNLHPYFAAGATYWFYGIVGILFGLSLTVKIVGIILARKLWSEFLPRVPRRITALFWFTLPVPGVLPLLYTVPAWKRGRAARILALFTAICLLGLYVLIPLVIKHFPELAGISNGSAPDRIFYWSLAAGLLLNVCWAALLIPTCEVRFTRSRWIMTAVPLALSALSFALPYPLMKLADTRFELRMALLRKAGGVTDIKMLADLYFQGVSPNPEWCALVDAYDAQNDFRSKSGSAKIPEQYREIAGATAKMLAAYRDNRNEGELERRYPAAAPEVRLLERLFAPGAPRLGYARDFTRAMTSMRMPDLLCSRNVSRYFSMRGQAATRQGNAAEALRLFHLALLVADHLFDGGEVLIGGLVGIATEISALEVLESALENHCLSLRELDAVEKTLAGREKNYRGIMRRIFGCEAVYCADTADRLVKTNGDIEHPEKYPVPPTRNPVGAPIYCFWKNDGAFCLDAWTLMLETMNQPTWSPDQPDAFRNFSKSDTKYPGRLLPDMLLSAMDSAWDRELRLETQNRMLQVACHVERFRLQNGRPPKTLAELESRPPLDPFNRKAFGYRPAPDGNGFTLWSVGRDRKDDGGNSRADEVFTIPRHRKQAVPSSD